MKKADTGTKKRGIKIAFLYIASALALFFAASVALRLYSGNQTDIFRMVEYGKSLQNNRILVASDIDITYLGTYQNTILAFDEDGGQKWSYEVSGSIGAMRYDDERKWLIIGSQDRNVYIFDALSGNLLATYSVGGKVYDMDYDQDKGQQQSCHHIGI